MEYKCIMWGIGHGQAKNIYKPGQPLYGWTIDLDTSVKPETYERALVVLTEYSNNAEFIENPFTPDENHSRYGLPDDYFWIQKKHIWADDNGQAVEGTIWGIIRSPLRDGDYVFFEKRKKQGS